MLFKALYQKQRIKKDFERKKLQEEFERKTDDSLQKQDEKATTITTKTDGTKYFPKVVRKDLLKEATEANRNYILKQTEKQSKKARKKNKKLSQNLLKQVRVEIINSNKTQLKRSESINRIKFPVRVTHPDDLIIRLPRSFLEQKRPSEPNLFNFDEYKQDHEYEPNLSEREWTRKIWNSWFDEVIPQLDGTGGRPPSVTEERKPNRDTNTSSNSRAAPTLVSRQTNQPIEVVDEEDNPDKKREAAKSPTPYQTYSKIDLFDSLDSRADNIEAISLLEDEIDKLNKRIEVKESSFDLARRGTLYRKLGCLSLALSDLNQSIEMEPNFVDSYWQRHLIYLTQDKKNEALLDLTYLLKLNRTHAGAYISM